MKKGLMIAVVLCAAFSLMAPGKASAFTFNWYLDLDGAGIVAPVLINETLDTDGFGYIQNTYLGGGAGTFVEKAVFRATGHDGGVALPVAPELTGIFNGAGVLAGSAFSFTSGTLDIYSDVGNDYAGTNGTYGANNGTLVGSFSLYAGGGNLTAAFLPNGEISTAFVATYLDPTYWIAPDLTPLTLHWPLVYGFGTTNGSVITNPLANQLGEFGPTDYPGTIPPTMFFAGANGQLRILATPEPASMLLLGMGLAGLAAIRRKKVVA